MTGRDRSTAAVIFDCDGVLVNSEELLQEIELAVLAEAGLVYGRQEYMDRFMGTCETAWWQFRRDTHDSGARLLGAGAERLVSNWVEAGELLQRL